ncbi:hypothetical protein MAR_033545 [Mya arenaria]|uniref:Uncharacterized protein n=1 Tax=Mya arenaria TaxID=6604 RepID=A0ABY7G9A7_MYAAR|nr:hypothetical protein MAR_033545 [Mya arenaria]
MDESFPMTKISEIVNVLNFVTKDGLDIVEEDLMRTASSSLFLFEKNLICFKKWDDMILFLQRYSDIDMLLNASALFKTKQI